MLTDLCEAEAKEMSQVPCYNYETAVVRGRDRTNGYLQGGLKVWAPLAAFQFVSDNDNNIKQTASLVNQTFGSHSPGRERANEAVGLTELRGALSYEILGAVLRCEMTVKDVDMCLW